MFRGRPQLGDHVFVSVRCENSSGEPANPDEAPVLDVWQAGVKAKSLACPRIDHAGVTGLFGYWLFLGAGLAAGQCQVVWHCRVGSHYQVEIDTFEILPGGDTDGAVLSMIELRRPHANFILHQLDSGRLRKGQNPRL